MPALGAVTAANDGADGGRPVQHTISPNPGTNVRSSHGGADPGAIRRFTARPSTDILTGAHSPGARQMDYAARHDPRQPEIPGDEPQGPDGSSEVVERFLAKLRPLLRQQSARSAWLFGSHALGTATPESDIDVIVVAPTDRIPVERFRDYLPAILAAGVGVDLFVYTPAEFERMQVEERPFLSHAMKSARVVHVG